jgi:phosphatidylserine synthase
MKFNWKKGLGFGALVWAVMFIVVCILLAYKMPQNMLFTVIVTVITLVAVFFFAKNIAPKNYMEALEYGLIFAIIGIILDFLISRMFAPNIFKEVYYWVSYLLVVLVPLLTVKKVKIESQNPQ